MSPELCIAIASAEGSMPQHVLMQKANAVYVANNGDVGRAPFAPVDIVFATFVDHLLANATQRERDLVFISENLQRCWTMLHVSVQVLKQDITPGAEASIAALVYALQRQEMQNLMLDGLRSKAANVLRRVMRAHPEH